jgi:hypothetical protein
VICHHQNVIDTGKKYDKIGERGDLPKLYDEKRMR